MTVSNIPKINAKAVIIRNTTKKNLPISNKRIKRLTLKILKYLKLSHIQPVGILFLNNKNIQKLNKKYFKRNCPTDVIVFNYAGSGADVALSLDMARANAKIYRTSAAEEILLYIIHAILHIAGYDDTTEKARVRMFRKQEEIFEKLKY